jgi:hypothetical protein
MSNSQLDPSDLKKLKKDLELSKGDYIHTLINTIIKLIPYSSVGVPDIGESASELFNAIILPPISKRRDQWIEILASAIVSLYEIINLDIEALSQNEQFITTVMYASQIAIRNHQKEKLEALRNAVLNSALGTSPEEDLELIFLNFIDTFTIRHLKLLEYFNKPISNELIEDLTGFRYVNKNDTFIELDLLGVLECIFDKECIYNNLKSQKRIIYEIVVDDLKTKKLLYNIGRFFINLDESRKEPYTTEQAQKFLSYINNPLN